jgi:Ca2+-binding RTX toxin-like protein
VNGGTLINDGDVIAVARGQGIFAAAYQTFNTIDFFPGVSQAVINEGRVYAWSEQFRATAMFFGNQQSVTNSGLIYAAGFSDVTGIVFSFTGTLNNSGLIMAVSGGPATIGPVVYESFEVGVVSTQGGLRINNSGTIDASFAIVSAGVLRLTNTGVIVGDVVGLGQAFIIGDEVVNSGVIFGDVFLGDTTDTFDGALGEQDGSVFMGGGDDFAAGGAGIDELFGESGFDTLVGGGGDDYLVGGSGADSLSGGAGFDMASYADALSGVIADLSTPSLNTGDAAGDVYTSIEDLQGSSFADRLTGNGSGNLLQGLAGDDVLTGGLGDDFLIGGAGSDTLVGGVGNDAAYFGGARSGFVVRAGYTGGALTFVVSDATGGDGTDSLSTIELLEFSGRLFGMAGAQQNHLSVLDGSRFDDVMFRNTSTGQVIYADMNGTASPGAFQNILGALPTGWRPVGSGDVTNDGRAEVFLQDTITGSVYTFNLATQGWGVVTTSLSGAYQVVGLGDFTQDGVVDILIRDGVSGAMFFGDVDAGGLFGGWASAANLGTGWRTVGVGDFDRDGHSDILVQEIATGVTYYRNVHEGQWGFVSGAVGVGWIAKEAGDLNGDGYFDVVFQNGPGGEVWYVNMLGGTNAGWGVVANGLVGWDVRSVADVDNDGYLDVIVQNTANGTTYYADINGGLFTGWGTVSGVLGTDWIGV